MHRQRHSKATRTKATPSKPTGRAPLAAARLGLVGLLALALASPGRFAHAQDGKSAWVDDAVRLVDARRFADARAELTALARLPQGDARVFLALGRVALAEYDHDEALKWFERAIEIEPGNAQARLWVARALMERAKSVSKMKRPFLAKRARSEIERAVALDPQSVEARRALLDFHLLAPAMLGGSIDKARADADAISTIEPLRGHLARAAVAQHAKDGAGAIAELRAAIDAYPDSTIAYVALAELSLASASYDVAVATYERLLARQPAQAEARCGLARALTREGRDLNRAERALGECAEATPVHDTPARADVHVVRGALYERRGERQRARKEYEAAQALLPRHPGAKNALKELR